MVHGTDEVRSSVSFVLGANFEILLLTGVNAINGTGNELANSLTGNAGNNILDGGAGADVMHGGLGNDAYFVDNIGDKVIESPGAGNDTVYSTTHFRLSADDDNLILDPNALDDKLETALTGFSGNWWAGLSLLHTLFARPGGERPHVGDGRARLAQ